VWHLQFIIIARLDRANGNAANDSFDLGLEISDRDLVSLDESKLVRPGRQEGRNAQPRAVNRICNHPAFPARLSPPSAAFLDAFLRVSPEVGTHMGRERVALSAALSETCRCETTRP
jgi:hypothetical protein